MKILITGGGGFVGRHLHSTLAMDDHTIVNIDTMYGTDAMLFFRNDTTTDFDVVFHCAAYVKGRSGIDGQAAYLHTYNTMLDAAMFEWALRNKPGRVVYYSSSAAYSVWDQIGDDYDCIGPPLREDQIDITQPEVTEASYGMSKLHGEQMAEDVRDAGVPVTIFRPFSGYGHDQSLDYPFPSFIARAKRRDDPFEVWGDGNQLRDWVHIDDIVGASIVAVLKGVDGPVNICTGRATSFTELAVKITRAAGYEPWIKYNTDASAGVPYRVGDPTELERFYVPKISIEEGIDRALAEAWAPPGQ